LTISTTSRNAQQANLEKIENDTGTITLTCSGDWTVTVLHDVAFLLKKMLTDCKPATYKWDVSNVSRFDSAGMILLINSYDELKSQGCQSEVIGMKPDHEEMYHLLREHVSEQTIPSTGFTAKFVKVFCLLGKKVILSSNKVIAFLGFIGEDFINFLSSFRHPSAIRYGAIIENIEQAGVRAVPIIAVTSFLIGVVIAYQGAVQLERFGANIFIVDMIGVSICRELAPLITAIVIAGRTGSAYTAEIGVMKITEEIDAMRTMGFDPHRFLVQPRIIALMIVLPLMIFFADIIGILGGMVIANLHMQLSYVEFLDRLQHVLDVKQVWIGIIKGPFFAWLIATIGCFYGFQVSNNTESIGRYTTISVVNSIFMVIACDALFSVILTELGI